MSEIWLPGDSDFALAMREPRLLVPDVKPIESTYVVDGSHDLAQGMTAYWSFLPGLGSPFQCHIKGAADRAFTQATYTWTSGSTADGYDQIGHYAGMTSDTGYAYTDSDNVARLSGTRATFYCWARLVHTTTTSSWAFGNIQTSVSNGYNWGIYVGGVNKDIVAFAKTSGGTSATSLSSSVINWGDGKPHFVLCTLDGANCITEVDGVYTHSTSQTPGNFTTSDFSIAFNRWLTQSVQGFNYYSAGVYPSRALNAAERQELFRRRGLFLKNIAANNTPYPISVPAGGGVPTLSLPGVTGVHATQATPQVTLTF